MLDIQFFRTPFATVTKSYRGDNGEMYVEGVASSTGLDQTKERMSPEAIQLMAAKFTGKPLNSEHHNDWDDQLGKIIESKVIDEGGKPALWIKAKLNDWMGRAKDLFTGLNENHLELGFSVEGKINPGGLVKEFDPDLGYSVPVYRDIEPGAVAVTNKPANLDTFCNAVTKSIKVDDLPEMKSGSYILVKKVLEGETIGEAIEKNGVVIQHTVKKDGVDLNPNKEGNPMVDNQTLECNHSVCPHGLCTDKACKNMCKFCMTAKDMGIANAGPVPQTLLARQDLATVGEGKDKTSTKKATTPDPTNTEGNGEKVPATNDADLKSPTDAFVDTHDRCEHNNCLEKGCPNECKVCGGTNQADAQILTGEDKLELGKKAKEEVEKTLVYFNDKAKREADGITSENWEKMAKALVAFLGGGYLYDASSQQVVKGESQTTHTEDAKKSVTEGGELNDMLHNDGVLQKSPYSQEVLDIIKAWGGTNPGNYDLFAKAGASAVSQQPQAPVQQVAQGAVQPQQTVQKGSSSSSTSPSSSSDSSSTDSSTGSSSTDSSSGSSSGDSLSSLLSSVLTTLSDMKSSVSGSSPSSSSDSSTGSSKTSTDKNFGGMSTSPVSDKTSTDKIFGSDSADSSDSTDEATKALSLALANFQAALAKTKKQPHDGNYAENGQQHTSGTAQEGADAVNGKAQEAEYNQEVKVKHPRPKAETGSTDNVNGKPQEADYDSLATKSMVANQEKFVKSIDTMIDLMTKLGQKVESVEGKVESMPGVRKGIAIDKQFTEEEKAEFAKNEQVRKSVEAGLIADPRTTFKELHQFRTYNYVPAWFQQKQG